MQCFHPQQGTRLVSGTKFDYSYRCGYCLACRIEERETWTARLLLELDDHQDAAFITLTYADEYLPAGEHLDKQEAVNWIRRLKRTSGKNLRYFLVGEYGELLQRPHYHAIIYGLPWMEAELVASTWPQGFTLAKPVTTFAARYVARYTVKKYTNWLDTVTDKTTGETRTPEFQIMSRRPGIAASAVKRFVDAASKQRLGFSVDPVEERDKEVKSFDFPKHFQLDGHSWPMPRYLRDKFTRGYSRSDDYSVGLRATKHLINLHNKIPEVVAEREKKKKFNETKAARIVRPAGTL